MAKARLVTVNAIAEWAKVFEQNRDMEGYGGKYKDFNGACTIDLIMDDDNVNKLQAAGCSKQPKPDPEGRGKRMRFERKFDTGYDWSSGAPLVTKLDGSPWSLDDDGLIGNGSLVEVDITIYDTQYGNSGSRLDRVMVTDHVAYNTQKTEVSHDGQGNAEVSIAPMPASDTVLF